MKTLQEIKEEVAKEANYPSWIALYRDCAFRIGTFENHTDKVAKKYAEAAIDNCAIEAMADIQYGHTPVVDHQSILDTKKELR